MSDVQPVAIIRSIDGLVFDAVFEESHESDLEVTDNPVETGVVVSDHAYMKPLRLTICAGVSDVSLRYWTTAEDGSFQLADSNDPFKSDAGRARKAFEMLTQLQRLAEPFSVQTGLKLYENMVCTSIRTKQDKDTDGALVFVAELREVIIVYTQVVKYPKRKAGATKRQASAKKDKGEQQATEVTNTPKKQSLAAKLKTALTGSKS